MPQTFKEKAATIEAVEFTDVLGQSASVANLIGATSMSVDMKNKRTLFVVSTDETGTSYTVEEGEVVGKIAGAVVVMAAEEFYAKYEAI